MYEASKITLPISHCDAVKLGGHLHFSEISLQVLLVSHETQSQLKV